MNGRRSPVYNVRNVWQPCRFFVRQFGVRQYVTTCYTWTLVDGGIIPDEGVCPGRSFGEKAEFARQF